MSQRAWCGGIALTVDELEAVLCVLNSGWVWSGKVFCVSDLCVDVNGTMPMHEVSKCKIKECDVGTLASLVDV